MKLFEVDLGAARDILAVLQGVANRKGESLKIPFDTLKNMAGLEKFGISTIEALIALKNLEDPAGDVIKSISNDGTIEISTRKQSQDNEIPAKKTSGPTIDAMAKSGAKKLTPDI